MHTKILLPNRKYDETFGINIQYRKKRGLQHMCSWLNSQPLKMLTENLKADIIRQDDITARNYLMGGGVICGWWVQLRQQKSCLWKKYAQVSRQGLQLVVYVPIMFHFVKCFQLISSNPSFACNRHHAAVPTTNIKEIMVLWCQAKNHSTNTDLGAMLITNH